MDIALLYVAALLVLGLALRVQLRFLQVLYIPAAIVAGLLGLLASPSVLGLIPENGPRWGRRVGLDITVAGPVLEFGDGSTRTLRAGDFLTIPRHLRHRVAATATGEPTGWLAVFLLDLNIDPMNLPVTEPQTLARGARRRADRAAGCRCAFNHLEVAQSREHLARGRQLLDNQRVKRRTTDATSCCATRLQNP